MANLHCSSCGSVNRPGRRFCADCGAPLPLACPACGFENDATEKFCGGCGQALAGIAIAAAAAPGGQVTPAGPAPAAAADGERRPVTVLFVDLVGYTKLSRTLDPEDVHALLGRFFETVDEIVERLGGSIDKHIGDAAMAVFGAPVARGDDAIRAVRAALEIQQAMPALGGGQGPELAAHIGIASGEVMASGLGSSRHRAYTVIGNSVNLAARLLELAGAGETVLDAAVHAAAQPLARCAPIEGARVKGIDVPVVAWRLLGLADAVDDPGAQPFVGRQAELAQLAALLRSCTTNATGGTVFVRGDAGIGKSRLVRELRRLAHADGFVCHTGLVLDFGIAKGRDAIREIVGGLLALDHGAGDDARHAALQQVLVRHASLAAAEPFLRDLLGLPQAAASAELYEAMEPAARQRGRAAAVVRLLSVAAAESPRLVVVEDVHWADKVTLEMLAALTRGAGTMPMVVALTSRIEGDPLDATWRAGVQGCPLLTIDLGPLGTRDALALAGGLVAVPPAFARRCVERSGGNPLFLEQLMRAADAGDDRLPASLHSLVLARTDRLPERDRAALRAAAVVGQRFALPLVRHLAGLPDYSADALIARFLVRREGDELLFAHALIRDGVYASLTRARRAELHRAAAEWYGERDPVLRAEHLDRAEAPEAPRAYLAAARAQAAVLQPERAQALAARGAALAKEPDDVVALNLLRGRLHCESGAGAPAVDAYARALAAAQGPAERCRALIGMAAGQRLITGLDAALAALEEAEPLARAGGLTRELAELHYLRGNVHFARGDIGACRAEHAAALDCARAQDDPGWEARALSGLADADYADGRMKSALARYEHCIELCAAHGMTRVAIPNRVLTGFCRGFLMEFDAGAADIEAAHALALKVGDRHVEMLALESQGMLLTFCDRHAEAEPLLRRAAALAETLGARRFQSIIGAGLAACALAAGRRAEARERIERALDLSRDSGMAFCGPLILGLRTRLQDDEREREQTRAEAEALLARGCASHNAIEYLRHGIEDALARSEWARALAHAAALEAHTRAEPLPYADFAIARARVLAGIAARPGDTALRQQLDRLRAEARRVRWPIPWPAWALPAGVTR